MLAVVAVAWISTLPGWAALGVVLAVAWAVWRGGGGTALATLQLANQVLERRVQELERQAKDDTRTIAELHGKTDMALAIKPFMDWAVSHERHAESRFERTAVILDLIAQRLGPDSS